MDAAHAWTDEQIEGLERRLSSAYSQAYKEMESKHARFMDGYERERKAVKAQLDAGDITAKEYKAWCSTQAMTERWYKDSVDYLSKRAVEADKAAMGIVNDTLPGIYAENYNWGTYNVEHETSINTMFALHDEDTIRELMKTDASLLPESKLNEMKDMRWNRQHFQSAITQGILQGESIPAIANRIQSVMQMNLNAATRSARTATTAAENMGRVASYDRAKSMGIDVRKEWLATLDGRTRHSHRQLDGAVIDNDQTFENGCRFPGDPQGPAWEVYNCRCTLVANIAGVDQSNAPRNDKLEGMSYEEWKDEHKQQETPQEPSYARKYLEHAKVEYRAVKKHAEQPTVDEIINRVGGGDKTAGSCMSLALCYTGNRNGFDVLDFRGGDSTKAFATVASIRDIAKLDGVSSFAASHTNDFKSASSVLKNVKTGKEYILVTGKHAAVVRQVEESGGKTAYEYLELQSAFRNGFAKLDNDVLRARFGCQKTHTFMRRKYEVESFLIDGESLKNNKEVERLLGYINTAENKQMKGASGTIK